MAITIILSVILINLLSLLSISSFSLMENSTETYMSREERANLKQEAVEMFYHAYNAYMNHAYPADELMPLSCKGRYRNSQPSRGNVDEALGNFSLTLIDTLDTLIILGDFEEFERAVKLVMKDVNFNTDVVVSVFETNIRVLGGLLSAHVLSDVLKTKYNKMTWYSGELLEMAKDLGYRLLPAFNTLTGIPYGRVNLKYGVREDLIQLTGHTCTACAGTMILEMAALSRLTGDPIFEQKAHKAMDELWSLRHRTSNLMGTILDVHSGDWVRKESGVGAGIDSYYEYCLKAYILLSDEKYLRRFNTHYSAVMTYVSQGPMLLDVHMHRPNTNSKNFMDALLAFWPGLQVLKGDLKPAIETHEMLYQVMQRHKFIPEAFTTDLQIHWGQHPLRPEFLESTYFLYRATGDHYYLHVGRNVLRSLQSYARVPCGYASVGDVRTGAHEDSMDSFVLAETFKYLFLLFAEPSDTTINLDDYLFTTEAHLLPLSISRYASPNHSNGVDGLLWLKDKNDVNDSETLADEDDNDMSRSCVIPKYVVGHFLRQNLRNMFEGICPQRKFVRKLHASQFQSSNEEHVRLLKDMGITVVTLSDGRIQLVHNYLTASSKTEAKEGALFMEEMVALSKTHSVENTPQAVSYSFNNKTVVLSAGPAHFGKLLRIDEKLTGSISIASPLRACEKLKNPEILKNRIAIVERGDCMFVDKARKLEKAGAIGGIIMDNVPDSSADSFPLFAMSGDGKDNVNIPVVFLFTREAKTLIEAVTKEPTLNITLSQLHADIAATNTILDAPITLGKFKGTIEGIMYKSLYKQETSEKVLEDVITKTVKIIVHSKSQENNGKVVDKKNDWENRTESIIDEKNAIELLKKHMLELLSTLAIHLKIESNKNVNLLNPNFNKIHVFSVTRTNTQLVVEELLLLDDNSSKKKEKYEKVIDILNCAKIMNYELFIEIEEPDFGERKKFDHCELEKKYIEIKKAISKHKKTFFSYEYESSCEEQKLAFSPDIKNAKRRRILKIKLEKNFVDKFLNSKGCNQQMQNDYLFTSSKKFIKRDVDISSNNFLIGIAQDSVSHRSKDKKNDEKDMKD